MGNFWNTIVDAEYKTITIPNYQRDYAQGRDNNIQIARDFVDDIYYALDKHVPLSLGLIYGSIKDKQLLLVDGQQRFTMLWLLHIYTGKCAGQDIAPLKKFYYTTRPAAERFCKFLIEFNLEERKELTSERLCNNTGFQYEWLNDPTVSGILVVLDILSKKIKIDTCADYFKLLTSENSPVYFEFLSINDITNEKIYMAMNVSGLELTAFEIFKSKLFKVIDNKVIEKKIDVEYTNCIWELLKEDEEKEKLVDVLLSNYIKEFARAYQTLKDDDVFFKTEMLQQEYEWINWFKDELFLNDFKQRFDAFEKYANDLQKLKIANWLKSPEYKDRTRLYALLNFLIKIEDNNTNWQDLFTDWWHVIENIVKHTDINASNYKNILELVDNLSNDELVCFIPDHNLYEQISKCDFKSQNTQWLQEKRKATLIAKEKTSKDDIYRAEEIPAFDGSLFFLLGFEKTKDDDTFDNDTFKMYIEIAKTIFNESCIINTLLVRASLTYGMSYSEPISFHRTEIDRYLKGHGSGYQPVKEWVNMLQYLFVDLIENDDSSKEKITIYLKERINGYPKQYDRLWLFHLITWEKDGKSLFDYSETKKIQTYDSECIYLYNKRRWTDGNILLSGLRNELVSSLLKSNPNIKHEWEWGNVGGVFFRGWDIWLSRKEFGFDFNYIIDKNYIRLGIRQSEEIDEDLFNNMFAEEDKVDGWIFQKKYKYSHIKDENQLSGLTEEIELEIFNCENPESLISQLLKIKL
jgi:hypothetical protein